MKRVISAIVILALLLPAVPAAIAASQSVVNAGKNVTVSGKSKSVAAVQVNLADPDIRVLSVSAGKVGEVANFIDIINSIDSTAYEVLAAVNGAFFESYNAGAQPIVGAVVKNGKMMHKYAGALIGFGADGTARLNYAGITVIGYVNGYHDRNYSFYVHNWNKIYPAGHGYRECILTPEFGTETGATDMVAIVVRDGVVTAISQGNTRIPEDGYVYLMPKDSPYNDGRFYVSADLMLETTFKDLKNDTDITEQWEGMYNITGCGPSLMLNGAVTANPSAENWTDPKLTRDSAQRSFIGLSSDKKTLVMGTAPACTIPQLAEVAKGYNLHDAMNLDGGASSALYLNGTVLTSPGRKLSNIIAVVRVKDRAKYAPKPNPGMKGQTPSGWAAEAVDYMIGHNVLPETLQNRYQSPITRSEFAAIMILFYEKHTGTFNPLATVNPYNDITGNLHALAIIRASYAKLITVPDDGKFNPNGLSTRETAATLISNVVKAVNPDMAPDMDALPDCPDAADVSVWAKPYVAYMQKIGLIQGNAAGQFNPKNNLTREGAIVLVYNMVTNLGWTLP